MAVNVNRNVVDPFYRYKMPSLVVKVEGRGNGVKTVIINLDDVARSLGRPAIYLIKYFSYELGTQTHFDSKNNRYIVNGLQDAGKLQDMLDLFIKNFVLCEMCLNPETTFKIMQKKGTIKSSCGACGHSFKIDMSHKLTNYIIRNPTSQEQITSNGMSVMKSHATAQTW